MTESSDPLVAAAVRPLTGDAEANSAAQALLETLKEEHAVQEGAALKRWETLDGRPRMMLWRAPFWIIVAVVTISMLAFGVMDFMGYRKIYRLAAGSDEEPESGLLDLTRFNESQKRLLKISGRHQSPTELAKDLWDSDPGSAAYFSEYCSAYFAETQSLPADFLAQADRLDPGNANFRYWAANIEAKDAVKKRASTKASRAAGGAPEWDVLDEPKLNRALAILHDSRNQPECRGYQIEMLKQRIPLLPQASPEEYYRSVSFLAMTSRLNFFSGELRNAVAAKAWLCGERGDAEGLLALKEDVDAYLPTIVRAEPGFIIEDIIIESWSRMILKNLAASAVKLGLAAEAAEIQTRLDRLDTLTADRKAGVFQIEGVDAHQKLSLLNRYPLSYLANRALHPPVLRDSDVKPGRMIEHVILAQMCTTAVWLLLGGVVGLAALYRFRSPRVIRGLSARMEVLLEPADWACLFLAGVPPFIYLLLITHFTPLGGSGSNVLSLTVKLPYDGTIPLPMAQFVGLLFMMLILPILVARWRLAKRMAFFGFGKPRLWVGALALVSAAAFIPVLGWAVTQNSDVALKASWVLLMIPLTWVLAVVIRAMTTGMNHLLHLTTASRILVPAYGATMVVLLMATPYFKWSRQHWFEQDPMARLDVAYPSLTRFEYELSVAARKELREALGYDR